MSENQLRVKGPSGIRWVDPTTIDAVTELLKELHLLSDENAQLDVSVAGEGNMNVTLRAAMRQSNGVSQSWIVKQSRPYVAKYDSIPAPIGRIGYEHLFYKFVQEHSPLAAQMPSLLAWLPADYLIVLEDLGEASDFTGLYRTNDNVLHERKHAELPSEICELFRWLMQLHTCSRGSAQLDTFGNLELRKLNHQHVFELPFQSEPVVDLDSICDGLSESSRFIRDDLKLRMIIDELGRQYLASGDCLLHGDFYPGSWLATQGGVRVIDPEFCFAGPAEFDVGVMLGHLRLAGFGAALDSLKSMANDFGYQVSWSLAQQFAGVEILRRILGVAQLPLERPLSQLTDLVSHAATMVRQ